MAAQAPRTTSSTTAPYVFCVLEHLHRALRRRDIFAVGSDRWGDPRTRLLSGEAWERAKPDVCSARSA